MWLSQPLINYDYISCTIDVDTIYFGGGKETQSCVIPTDNVYYLTDPFQQQWDDNDTI
jgi:hypothetical protein